MPKVFHCPFCRFKTNWPRNLRTHNQRFHCVQCPHCRYSSNSYTGLRSHVRTTHTVNAELVENLNSIEEFERACDLLSNGIPEILLQKLSVLFQSNPQEAISNCRERTLKYLKPLCVGNPQLQTAIVDRESNIVFDNLLTYHCRVCLEPLFSATEQFNHMRNAHPDNGPTQRGFGLRKRDSTVRNSFQVFEIDGASLNPVSYLNAVKKKVANLIKKLARELGGVKWALVLHVTMQRNTPDGDDSANIPFRSKMQFSLSDDESIDYTQAAEEILHAIDEFQERGSGWKSIRVHEATLEVAKANPPGLQASSYLPTPPDLHGLVNVENNDIACFKWAVLASVFHQQIPALQRTNPDSYRQFEDHFNWSDIDFPVSIDEIKIFEKNNNISVNVYLYDPAGTYPCKLSMHQTGQAINLLLLYDQKTMNSHYITIIDLADLFYPFDENMRFVCPFCLSGLLTQARKDRHIERCFKNEPVRIQMNEPGSVLEFKELYKTLKAPFVVYADFESLLVKMPTCMPDPDHSSTTKKAHHVPVAVSALLLGPEGIVDTFFYMGQEAVVEEFLHRVDEWAVRVDQLTHEKINMTPLDWINFRAAEECYLCKRPFEDGEKKCRDHCVVTGKFRGSAHISCNLQYKISKKLPVLFHNLENYDGHFLVTVMAEQGKEIEIIPKTYERYICIQYKQRIGTTADNKAINMNIQFIDSFHHLSASLSTLASNLHQHSITDELSKHELLRFGSKELVEKIVNSKLPFCYEYLDDYSKLLENNLPPREAFYSDLNLEAISEEDYRFLQELWIELRLTNLGQFLQLYVLIDTHLLADIFEEYRTVSLENYGLDPAHYITSPSLAWSAALKITKVKLELLTDVDMLLLFEELRGGVSMITKRFARANNEAVDYYDATKPKSFILDLDINSLYPSCMVLPLPVSDFAWIDPDEFPNIDELDPDGEVGFVLECDLHYDQTLHDRDSDLPLMPERIKISREMESPFGKRVGDFFGRSDLPKLSPNFFPKKKYVVHSTTLQYYCSRGIQITAIHRVIRFKQRPWLKPFIMKNIELRKKATTKFEKSTYKLMSNSVYGKSCESLRNRVNVRLLTDLQKAESLVFSPTFAGFRIFSEDLIAVKLLKQSVKMNRPIYLGFTILEYAKQKLYETFSELKEMFPTLQLLATDTDSFIIYVQHDDPYSVLCPHIDCSNFPPEDPRFSEDKKQQLSVLKDEKCGVPLIEFCGLRSKVYSLKDVNQKEEKRCKGVSRSVVKHCMDHGMYVGSLFGLHSWTAKQTLIRNYNHNLYTVSSTKLALVPYDNKRYLLDDGVETRPYGHYKNV